MTASVYEFTLILTFITGVLTLFFYALAHVYLYSDVSLLLVFVSILFFEIILSFVIKFISEQHADLEQEDDVGYDADYGETMASSADIGEIDFSEEIVHE